MHFASKTNYHIADKATNYRTDKQINRTLITDLSKKKSMGLEWHPLAIKIDLFSTIKEILGKQVLIKL